MLHLHRGPAAQTSPPGVWELSLLPQRSDESGVAPPLGLTHSIITALGTAKDIKFLTSIQNALLRVALLVAL